MVRATGAVVALLLALAGGAQAQAKDALVRIGAPASVGAGERVGTLVVINADAVVDGVVDNQLIVINGTARVSGGVRRGVTAINGAVVLGSAATVGHNVVLYRSTFTGAPARVAGHVVREGVPSLREAAFLFWAAITLVLLAGSAAYTFLSGTQLAAASDLIRDRTVPVIVATIGIVVALPALALGFMLTGVGVPIAAALMMFALPAIAVLGYIVAGVFIGRVLLREIPWLGGNPYITAIGGVLALQLLAALPAVGLLAAMLASQLGAGALTYHVWMQHRRGLQGTAG